MLTLVETAAAVRSGRTSAVAIVERCLAGLHADGDRLAAVTRILGHRARDEARAVDAAVAAGVDPGPLAGVPYGVKDLFDVAGVATTAGSAVFDDAPPAAIDAVAIGRLHAAGAVLVATLNMDEFAYGFATINARHGTTRNPHDLARLAGGSSGGSAAAVAGGLVTFALGSDTNGSVRVPASLTGIYGIRPTHGTLPLAGVFPLAASLDEIGPFARSVADLERLWEVLSGTTVAASTAPIRVARLGGRFRVNADPEQLAAIDRIAPDAPFVELPDMARARSAGVLITAAEGGMVHRAALATHAMRFDPATRDRLIAGALLPRGLYDAAQAFRGDFARKVAAALAGYDVVLAPAAPCVAPPIDDPWITIDGERRMARRDLGIHTQPISLTGLPSLGVPLRRPGRLPLGLQLIGRAGGEAALLRFAGLLEARGVIGVSPPPGRDETGNARAPA